MIEVNMLRYHNTFTMKMTDQQLHMLKMKVELLDQQTQEKIGRSDYENILVKEAQKMVAA